MKRLLPLLGLFAALSAAEPAADAPVAEAKPYTLTTCIVSGETLGEMGAPVVMVHEGQEVKFCCKSCIKKFNKAPETYLEKMKAATSAAPAPAAEATEAKDAHAEHQH
jgi:YHS domain-containing protein